MSWLIFLSHGLNPFILMLHITNSKNNESGRAKGGVECIFETVLATIMLYAVWLGVHYLVLKINGAESAIYSFMGVDKGLAYFLPFILGAVLLVNEYIVRPKIKSDERLATASLLSIVLVLFGCYFMLVNYLAWLSE